MNEPIAPARLVAPDRISPTQFTAARRCPLHFVLDKNLLEESLSLPSSSAARYAGSVLHRVIEAARRGEAGDPPNRERLGGIWQRDLSQIEQEVAENGDGTWLPLIESCSDLEQTRLWCIREAEKQRVRTGPSSGAGQTETWLQSDDALVAGKLDAIETDHGHLLLQDFKSGSIHDASGDVRSEYRDQMFLYAALHFECRGSWPDELRLVDKRGHSTNLVWTPALAVETLRLAKLQLRSISEAVGDGGTLREERISRLARPDGGACSNCRSRPICPGYLEQLQREGLVVHGDSRYSPVDTVGVIVAADETSPGRVRFELQCPGNVRSILGLTRSGRFRDPPGWDPDPDGLPAPGDLVVVFNVRPRHPLDTAPEAYDLVASRSTRAFKLPSPQHSHS